MSLVYFAVYESGTGSILRTGQCQSSDVDLQPNAPSESVCVVDQVVDDLTHRIDEHGEAVLLP